MTKEEFLDLYACEQQYKYSRFEERCHTGTAPTLRDVAQDFGANTVVDWIKSLIVDLQGYTSARQHLDAKQLHALAWIILTQYGYMKTTELLLFMVKAKAGQFGKFYNTIDPMDISTALSAWDKECNRIKADCYYKRAQEERERERTAATVGRISPDEAIRLGLIKNELLKKLFRRQ